MELDIILDNIDTVICYYVLDRIFNKWNMMTQRFDINNK